MTKNRRTKMKARALAASTGATYTSALRQVTGAWTLEGAVGAEVEGILENKVPGMDLDAVGDLTSLNANLDLFEPTVQLLVPDLDTLDIDKISEYDGGTVAINITVEAELTWEGMMFKAQAYSAVQAGQVEFIDEDFDNHYSQVQVIANAPVIAKFTGIADPHTESIASMEFEGATVALL